MGLKKRNKVSALFSMSSLTDIIFLLLIFFMLTSSLVAPNALNLKFPGKSGKKIVTTSEMTDVAINSRGNYYLDGARINQADLDRSLRKVGRSGRKDISISPNPNAPIESVATVMDMALRYHLNAILMTEE